MTEILRMASKFLSWVFPTSPECLWNSFNKRRTQRSSLSLTWHDLALTFSRYYFLKDFLFLLKISLLYFICLGIRYFLIYQESGHQEINRRHQDKEQTTEGIDTDQYVWNWQFFCGCRLIALLWKSAEFFLRVSTKSSQRGENYLQNQWFYWKQEAFHIIYVKMPVNVFVYFKPFSTMWNLQSVWPDSKVNQTGISAIISRFR